MIETALWYSTGLHAISLWLGLRLNQSNERLAAVLLYGPPLAITVMALMEVT